MLNTKKTLIGSALAALIPVTDVAIAQVPDKLEEIIVTARKRNESLLEVPVSIQAFSARDIMESGVGELEDLAAFTPGLDFQNLGSSQAGRYVSELRFRGMNTDQLFPINTTGAFLVDGISIAAGQQSVGFADIARVEVIRGPQPVFFGRGTFGGAANYITKDPQHEFGGEVSLDYSPTFGSHNLSLSVENGLIDDVLAGRITVSSVQRGGMFTSTDGATLGEERTDAFNGTLLFTPNEKLRIKARATFSEDRDGAAATTFVPFRLYGTCDAGTPVTYKTDQGEVTGALTADYVCGDVPVIPVSNNTNFYTVPGRNGETIDSRDILLDPDIPSNGTPSLNTFGLAADFFNVSITADYEISDSLSLTALYGSNKRDVSAIRDADGTDSEGWITRGFLNIESESYEVRLAFNDDSKLRAMVGVSYFDSQAGGDLDAGYTLFSNVFGGPFLPPVTTEDSQIETLGLFAAVEYDITDQFSIALEARYQDEEKTDGASNGDSAPVYGDPLASETINPRLIATYSPGDNTTLYASYSEGTLPGQVNSLFLTLPEDELADFQEQFPGVPAVLGDETITNIELGWKQSFPDAGAWFSLAVYSMEWEGLKTAAVLPFSSSLGAVASVRLEGSATLEGVEFEGGWAPTDNLDFHLAYGYNDATYDEYTNSSFNRLLSVPAGSNFRGDGNTLPRTPKHSGALSATWTGPTVGAWESYVRGDYIFNGETYTDATNLATIAGYEIINLRFGMVSDEQMRLELYCRNCADEGGWRTGRRLLDFSPSATDGPNFFTFQGAPVQPIDKRELGVRFSYDF